MKVDQAQTEEPTDSSECVVPQALTGTIGPKGLSPEQIAAAKERWRKELEEQKAREEQKKAQSKTIGLEQARALYKMLRETFGEEIEESEESEEGEESKE